MKDMSVSLEYDFIQGGMGVYISTPFLANVVSRLGALGTVSGVAPERMLAIILGLGDPGGHYRRALAHFPFPHIAQKVLDAFYIEEGNPRGLKQRPMPMFTPEPSQLLIASTVCANFAFVWLAKEGHSNRVSVNFLTKIGGPIPFAMVGVMLAGVDVVTMGAGIPRDIPKLMLDIMAGLPATYQVPVVGKKITSFPMTFDYERFFGGKLPPLKLPLFLPIVGSDSLASILFRKCPQGSIAGFVVEGESAAGHNAPPRTRVPDGAGGTKLVYGAKDAIDYQAIAKLGVPVWLAGSQASPEAFAHARSIGARGVQLGTLFAFCEESGMHPELRRQALQLAFNGRLPIETNEIASPTGFPFKVAPIPGTIWDQEVYAQRSFMCDQGVLTTWYETPQGTIGTRCPAEPVEDFVAKGGLESETKGKVCLCKSLIGTTVFGCAGYPPIMTLGRDACRIAQRLMKDENSSYTAADALAYLRGAKQP